MTLKELLEIIKWPITAIILAIIFRGAVITLLSRIKKIGYGETGVELKDISQKTKDPIETLVEGKPERVKRALSIFNDETTKMYRATVVEESGLNDVKEFDKADKDKLVNYAVLLNVLLNFERNYSIIFGSQIRMLMHLNSSIDDTKENLKSFYDYALRKYPLIYQKYSYDEWLDFLYDSGYIVDAKNSTVRITILGRDFLKFIIETGKTEFRPN